METGYSYTSARAKNHYELDRIDSPEYPKSVIEFQVEVVVICSLAGGRAEACQQSALLAAKA